MINRAYSVSSSSSSRSDTTGSFSNLKFGRKWVDNRNEAHVKDLEGGHRLELNQLKDTLGYSKHLELLNSSRSTEASETELTSS
jgi:hypothetical protein